MLHSAAADVTASIAHPLLGLFLHLFAFLSLVINLTFNLFIFFDFQAFAA